MNLILPSIKILKYNIKSEFNFNTAKAYWHKYSFLFIYYLFGYIEIIVKRNQCSCPLVYSNIDIGMCQLRIGVIQVHISVF